MDARASGVSGVSCIRFSSLVLEITSCNSTEFMASRALLSFSRSAASSFCANAVSGFKMRVVRCGFFKSMRSIISSKRVCLDASWDFTPSRGAWKATSARGSSSCNQVVSDRNMSASPRGKCPVLFSRRANSIVFKAASVVRGSMPSLTRWLRVSKTRSSTLSASSKAIPLRPVEKYIWRNSLPSPSPARSSPRLDSIRALRKGEPGIPRSVYSKICNARFCSLSAVSLSNQFKVTIPFDASSSPAAKERVSRRGPSNAFCSWTLEFTSNRSKSFI